MFGSPASRRRRGLRRSVLVAALAVAASTPAPARTLYWSGLDVAARLEADGRLAITETHAMVFTGAWNGGERELRLAPGQSKEFLELVRITPGGDTVPLERGSLDRVDQYKWIDRRTLRWRSRLPEDPPFDETELVYRLRYRLGGILEHRGADRYVLDHDFAFPDRVGPIARYRLELELDPVWRAGSRAPDELVRENLAPGESVVLTLELTHTGGTRPAAVAHRLAPEAWLVVWAAALVALAALAGRFLLWERSCGRFAAGPGRDEIDRAWIERELLALLPEEAGAIWDQRIGAPEVAAMIARLVGEGKLSSEVEETRGWLAARRVLKLALEAPRASFGPHERPLVDKLFFGGRESTDTEAVRRHYRSRGFSPPALIRPGLEKRLARRPELAGAPERPSRQVTASLFAACGLALALELLVRRGLALPWLGVLFFTVLPPAGLAYAAAATYRRRAGRPYASLALLALALALLAAVPALALRAGDPALNPSIFGLGAAVLAVLGFAASVLNLARARQSSAALALRRRLGAARRWLGAELRRRRPELDDAWLPYLLAFGLEGRVDRWFRAFGATGAASRGAAAAAGSGSAAPSWSGGGGRFGGAGATAAWSAAATGLASGFAAPSSGGGSGGGGGGGGSSGGGGGGGW